MRVNSSMLNALSFFVEEQETLMKCLYYCPAPTAGYKDRILSRFHLPGLSLCLLPLLFLPQLWLEETILSKDFKPDSAILYYTFLKGRKWASMLEEPSRSHLSLKNASNIILFSAGNWTVHYFIKEKQPAPCSPNYDLPHMTLRMQEKVYTIIQWALRSDWSLS